LMLSGYPAVVPFLLMGFAVIASMAWGRTGRAAMIAGMVLLTVGGWSGLSVETAFLIAAAMVGVAVCVAGWRTGAEGLGTSISLLAVFLMLTGKGELLVSGYELYALGTFLMILSAGRPKTARRYVVMNQVFGVIPLILAYATGFRPLYVFPILFRAGLFPFHSWVPGVYGKVRAALTPVFMLGELVAFHMALTAWPGQYCGYLFAVAGSVSTFAALYSFREIRLKKKFSYGSITDVGMAFFGLGGYWVTGREVMLYGSLLYILYQVLYKSAVFVGLSAVEHYGEEPNVCSIRKLLSDHLMSSLLYASSLAMAGVPPFASFVSRWMIYQGMSGAGVVLWLTFVPVVFLGAFPLASLLQLRSLGERICGRKVSVTKVPRGVVAVTGFLTVASLTAPLSFALPSVRSSVSLPLAVVSALLMVSMLAFGWKLGRTPTERVSEILLIFYSLGGILRETAAFAVDLLRRAYLHGIVPVIKDVPGYEVPTLESSMDALDYETRHIDEAMFMPFVRAVERASRWGTERNADMNVLMSGFAIAFAVLVVLVGIMLR